ncbi:DMT family transporter, partial [Veillonella caviae]
VSFNVYIEGVRRIGAVQGSILSSLEPISAALFGWALLGNEFTLLGILGMILILTTVFIIAYEKQRKLKREVMAHLSRK